MRFFPTLEYFARDRRKMPSSSIFTFLLLSYIYWAAWAQQIVIPPTGQIPTVNSPESGSYIDTPSNDDRTFRLRHILHHGAERYPRLLRQLDVLPSMPVWQTESDVEPRASPDFKVKSRTMNIRRMRNREKAVVEGQLLAARSGYGSWAAATNIWDVDEVAGPNITDKETVLNFAKMTQNAYVHVPGSGDWREVGEHWNHSASFGWENDGLRGHIFVDDSNSTVIMSIKGTSFAFFYGEETQSNDKINDNLLFSCCCGRVSAFWRTVCNCYTDTYSCSSTCLADALMEEDRYYRAVLNLYYNVTSMYPDSNVWVIGHSLGGAMSSLLGLTYGLPVVTFEAVPDALPAARLGIPAPPGGKHTDGLSGAYHFGNNADPIYLGVCNGATSICWMGGYAMESKCHSGNMCMYDTVNDLGWRVNGNAHRIQVLIDQVITAYEKVPECIPEDEECVDCFAWKFHNGTVSTTTTSTKTTSISSTRTTTCHHPGWWGCLDETTTTTSSSSSTSSTSSKTCTHYGWFGNCLDPTTTTTMISIQSSTTTAEPVTTSSIPRTTSASSSSVVRSLTTSKPKSCKTPAFFWGCKDRTDSLSSTSSLRLT